MSEDEIAAVVDRTDRDIASGHFVTVATREQSEVVHRDVMVRLHARLSRDNLAR